MSNIKFNEVNKHYADDNSLTNEELFSFAMNIFFDQFSLVDYTPKEGDFTKAPIQLLLENPDTTKVQMHGFKNVSTVHELFNSTDFFLNVFGLFHRFGKLTLNFEHDSLQGVFKINTVFMFYNPLTNSIDIEQIIFEDKSVEEYSTFTNHNWLRGFRNILKKLCVILNEKELPFYQIKFHSDKFKNNYIKS